MVQAGLGHPRHPFAELTAKRWGHPDYFTQRFWPVWPAAIHDVTLKNCGDVSIDLTAL